MFSIFGNGKKCIECCYCAKVMRIAPNAVKCECGKQDNPLFYMQDYAIAKPLHIPLVGWSSVGKTVWLLSVTRRLRELSASVWDSFVATPANVRTMEFFREVEAAPGKVLPRGTQLEDSKAYIVLLKEMPLWGSRTLVVRDVPGEMFNEFTIPAKYEELVRFLKNSRSAIFMFSVADLKKNAAGHSMEQLLHGYMNTLMKQGVELRKERRKLVIVLTKADLLQKEVPKHLLNYVRTDPIALAINGPSRKSKMNFAAMSEYVKAMTCMSDEIRDWVATRPDGKSFINEAKSQNIELRFSMVSCLDGQSEGDGAMGTFWEPYRVLDPLFWGLEFHSTKAERL